MANLNRDLIFVVLQFLYEHKLTDAAHQLERESGFYFNTKYFEELVLRGEWYMAEEYLSGFTKVDDNRESMGIFYAIRRQKYLEALDEGDRAGAANILMNDLKVFSASNEDLYNGLTKLIALEDFREHEELINYKDTEWARNGTLGDLNKLINSNPLFEDKLQFPSFENNRMETLINQSLNWQHSQCKNRSLLPEFETLFTDHACPQPSAASRPNPLMGPISNTTPSPQLSAQMAFRPFQTNPAVLPRPLASWSPNSSTTFHTEMSRIAANLANAGDRVEHGCVDVWMCKISELVTMESSVISGSFSDTRLWFHHEQTHFLVVQESHIAVYECANLDSKTQWMPREANTMIIHAVYSCNGKVYVASPSSVLVGPATPGGPDYIHADLSSSVYPVTVVALPAEPAQFAVDLTDGGLVILERSDYLD